MQHPVTQDSGTCNECVVWKNRGYQISEKPSSAVGLGYGGSPKVFEGKSYCYARDKQFSKNEAQNIIIS